MADNKKNYKVKKEPYDKKRYDGAVKVREIKVVEKTEEDEYDEEEDKKLILIIAASILVIIGTIIGLLVGYQEGEIFDDGNDNPGEDVNVDNDKIIENEDNLLKEETLSISSIKKNESSIKYYSVYYYYSNDKMHHEKLKYKSSISKYEPKGYYNCKYYTDINKSNKYDFNKKLKKDLDLYLDCEVEEYNVNYIYDQELVNGENENPLKYNASDSIVLESLNTDYKFLGWYLNYDSETDIYSNRVYVLDRSLYKYMSDNSITLYGKIEREVNVIYHNIGENTISYVVNDLDLYELEENIFNIDSFLGWTKSINGKSIIRNISNINDGEINLYPVIGDAIISYESVNNSVMIGYTDEELISGEFELPTPSDLGFEAVYSVELVDDETEGSKVVVSDDDIEIDLNKQITLSKAKEEAINGYNPSLGDNVLEHELEFEGWMEIVTTVEGETISDEIITKEEVIEELDENSQIDLSASYETNDIVIE